MKKYYLLICLIVLSVKLSAYFDLSLAHGISAGNISFFYAQDEKVMIGDIITYKIVEDKTKFGISVNLFSLGYADINEEILYKLRDPLSIEVSWDPLFELNEWLRFSIFHRVGDYITGDRPIEYRSGVRIGFNIIPASNNYTGYPFFHIETGLRNFEDYYVSVNFDFILYYGLEFGFIDLLHLI